jgi:hypothetical protein
MSMFLNKAQVVQVAQTVIKGVKYLDSKAAIDQAVTYAATLETEPQVGQTALNQAVSRVAVL